MNLRSASLAALLAAPLAACTAGSTTGAPAEASKTASRSTAKKGGPVIARWGDETLTGDELTAKLNERSPFERARMNTPERKKEFVEQLARFELLADEAKKRGLDQDPEVVRAMQTVMVRKLIQAEIDDNPEKKKFSDEELKAYYDAHHDDFQRPEMVRLSAIVLNAPSADAAKKRKGEADAMVKDLKAKSTDFSAFGAMVAKKSEDAATKQVQGDLRFLSKDQLTERYGAEVASAGFALTQGQISDPVVTAKGVFVLKLNGRTPAVNQTLDQAKNMLSQRVWYEKRTKLFDGFIDELKKKNGFTIDQAELDKFQVAAPVPSADLTSLKTPGGTPPPGATPPAPGMHAAAPVQAAQAQPAAPAGK
jgi:peptidyl-prolyl cis-trans isomerase C